MKGIDALRPRAATYRVSDGGGLLLEVRPSGAKVCLCRLTVAGRRRDMGLGGYPAVPLREARAAARAAREAAAGGADPLLERGRRARAGGRTRGGGRGRGAHVQGGGARLHRGAGAGLEERAHG